MEDRLLTRKEAAGMLGLTINGLKNREARGTPGPSPIREPGCSPKYSLIEVQAHLKMLRDAKDDPDHISHTVKTVMDGLEKGK